MESKKYTKVVSIAKKEQTHIYGEEFKNHQRGEKGGRAGIGIGE